MINPCHGVVSNGAAGTLVDIECHFSNNLPIIVIVGFASKAVNEAKDRLRGAFMNSGLQLPRKRITINLAPADIPKSDSGLDLAIAAAILGRDNTSLAWPPLSVFIGELSLDGRTRAVRGIIGKLLAARQAGVSNFFIARSNLPQAQLVPGITLYAVDSLKQLYEHLTNIALITPVLTGAGIHPGTAPTIRALLTIDDIVGQHSAKRALIIAAAGGHNVFLNGPPGTGKSMLAKALPSLLPPLSHEEMLEVTHLSSLSSNNYEQLVTQRPIRSPHHSASLTAMIGGGNSLKPGEISLSHRGVLFLDEFPEFNRATLEALRQPLEDRVISVTRAKDSVQYPANFILIATANPCPCGYADSLQACSCQQSQLQRYRNKLSGPIFDRIDLCSSVHNVEYGKLLTTTASPPQHQTAQRQIAKARAHQLQRYGTPTLLTSTLPNRLLRQHAHLSPAAKAVLQHAANRLHLSARAYISVVKVARTIADLEDSPTIERDHLHEALIYRPRVRT